MKEKTIYDLPDMTLKAYKKNLLEDIGSLEAKHRATRDALLKEGKTYRSRFVACETGYLNAFASVKETITRPDKNGELQEAIAKFGDILREAR